MDRATTIPIIGIVGGIASGKSLVAGQFARRGAAVVSADALAHEVLTYDSVKQAARERWGEAVFAGDQLDRAALAKIVFAPPPAGPRERKYLEQLTHPEIGRRALAQLEALRAEHAVPAIVLDVPLLLEAGWNQHCTHTVLVDVPRERRLQRALQRGWTAEEFDRREAAQQSLDHKRVQADYVIDNAGTEQATQDQVNRFWDTHIAPRLAP